MKLMRALKFDLHVEDSISALLSLLTLFQEKTGLSENTDKHKEFLLKHKLAYLKSDLFFTLHPLHFNLLLFRHFLKHIKINSTVEELIGIPAAEGRQKGLDQEIVNFALAELSWGDCHMKQARVENFKYQVKLYYSRCGEYNNVKCC